MARRARPGCQQGGPRAGPVGPNRATDRSARLPRRAQGTRGEAPRCPAPRGPTDRDSCRYGHCRSRSAPTAAGTRGSRARCRPGPPGAGTRGRCRAFGETVAPRRLRHGPCSEPTGWWPVAVPDCWNHCRSQPQPLRRLSSGRPTGGDRHPLAGGELVPEPVAGRRAGASLAIRASWVRLWVLTASPRQPRRRGPASLTARAPPRKSRWRRGRLPA